jgi:uncharacterized protein
MVEQTKVHFESGGVKCVGHLYHLSDGNKKLACIILGTGFGGTQDTPSIQAVARAFAEAGFAALTFDYRNFGESGGTPRQFIQLEGQHEDFHAAIRWTRNQPQIDPERIALWGTSLGGGHVISVAADDSRIAAVVAQIPFNGFPKQVEGRSAAATLRLLAAMSFDAIRGKLGLPPYYIRAVGTTAELAVMASPQAQETIDAMHSTQWKNQVAPRVLFEMMRYKPSDKAHRLTMPVLVCLAEFDREGPAALGRQLAERAPRGELKNYPYAHFDFYRPEVRAKVVNDQLEFLRKHLRARPH